MPEIGSDLHRLCIHNCSGWMNLHFAASLWLCNSYFDYVVLKWETPWIVSMDVISYSSEEQGKRNTEINMHTTDRFSCILTFSKGTIVKLITFSGRIFAYRVITVNPAEKPEKIYMYITVKAYYLINKRMESLNIYLFWNCLPVYLQTLKFNKRAEFNILFNYYTA